MTERDDNPTTRRGTGSGNRSGTPAGGRFWRRIRPLRRFLYIVLLCLLPVFLLAGIGLGVLYVRLASGPVSLSYLKPQIERQISQKLGGLNVAISDVVLSLVGRRAEFRLADVKLRDGGEVVAQAPMASMEIDRAALFRGVVSPTGIVLIRPRMRVAYSDDGELSLSFARGIAADAKKGLEGASPISGTAPAQANISAPTAEPNVKSADGAEQQAHVTVLRSIANVLGKLRSGPQAGRSLDRIGVRNALVELHYGGRQSQWGVPSADIDIKHAAERSVISGLMTVVESEGQNIALAFHAETLANSPKIELRTSIRDLRPVALVRVAPHLAGLRNISVPLSIETVLNMTEAGNVVDGRTIVEFGAGSVGIQAYGKTLPWPVDHGRAVMHFRNGVPDINIERATVGWGGGNELVLSGRITPRINEAAEQIWSFEVSSESGRLVAQSQAATQQAVEQLAMSGHVVPSKNHVVLDRAIVSVAGLKVLLSGELKSAGETQFKLSGRFGAGPFDGLKYFWPRHLADGARDWVARNIAGGQITSGEFSVAHWDGGGQSSADPRAASADMEQSIVLEARDIGVMSPVSGRPIFAPKALLRLKGDELEISAPAASVRLEKSRAMALKQVRFEVASISEAQPIGRLGFKIAGDLRDGAAVLQGSVWRRELPTALISAIEQRANGKIDGRFDIALPLFDQPNWTPDFNGKVQIKDVRVKDILANHDVSGGSFDLNLGSKSLNATGEMLVDSVATKLAWQYILGAPLESQPPLRLESSLDESDRDRLGIKINHIVRGVVDVAVTVVPQAAGKFGAVVRADATKATISVESLAWVKPSGVKMQLEFEMIPDKNYPVLLDNVRVVGDGIAIQGQAMLDAKYNLQAFALPQFSIDRVTRLQISGKLQSSNIWKVLVQGQTFEGRALFRSLFQAGRVSGSPEITSEKQPGLDLVANVSTVLGYWNSRMSDVSLSLSKRKGKIQSMQLKGKLEGDKNLQAAIGMAPTGDHRELQALSDDAGKALELVGFYPNIRRGNLELAVNLDGRGATEKAGILLVRRFKILNDQIVGAMAKASRQGIKRRQAALNSEGGLQAINFDWMRLPFLVGSGQFILQGAELRGPVVGATIEGKADFATRTLDLSGTYVPLQGLNGALGVIPGLGQLLAGPNGEGVLGMKFAVRGPMNGPEILVNPLSIMAPGIFREIFQISNPSLEVTPNAQQQAPRKRSGSWRRGAFGEN